MYEYKAYFWGCKNNALGRWYWITHLVWADSFEDANIKIYEDYEHIMSLTMTNLVTGEVWNSVEEAQKRLYGENYVQRKEIGRM